ncbi:hypothetical protein Ddye_000324 [Dipteronia dyeriana]|uniref:Uncharacterized protein n=1 Tax=Dipteronia dyeriana TaxID=168575 RepID=A0AAE0CS94_9ROSI|nr:hypothetical protein Ddye_000324 [Dipteronia dyeriana]
MPSSHRTGTLGANMVPLRFTGNDIFLRILHLIHKLFCYRARKWESTHCSRANEEEEFSDLSDTNDPENRSPLRIRMIIEIITEHGWSNKRQPNSFTKERKKEEKKLKRK